MQKGITMEDKYHFDKTRFTMALVATAEVLLELIFLETLVIQPGNQEWATCIECISFTGWSLPPCIIFGLC